QFRSGGTIDNNLWLRNAVQHNIGAPIATGPASVTNNVYLEGVMTVAGMSGPATMNSVYNGNTFNNGVITFSGNILANASATGAQGEAGIGIGTGETDVAIQNNIFFNWGSVGSEIINGSGGYPIAITPNQVDTQGTNSYGFPNPYQLSAIGNSS